MQVNVIANLTSLSGVVHRVCKTGIYTDNIFRPFKYPIINEVDKAGTSPSGIFIYLIIRGKLFLVTVCKSALDMERIGDPNVFFYDAAFNNEESLLITLSNDCCFHILEIYPPIHICAKSINLPLPPISFNYYQLQNTIKITVEDQSCFFYKFPNLFDPEDPAELQLITNITQDENGQFIHLFEAEEENEENQINEQVQIVNEFAPPANLKEFALQTLQRGQTLQNRQKELKERYEILLKRIDANKSLYFEITSRIQLSKKNITNQVKKIYDILSVADDYVNLISNEFEKFEELMEKVDDTLCDDDSITKEQGNEFKNFHFRERLENISNLLQNNANVD